MIGGNGQYRNPDNNAGVIQQDHSFHELKQILEEVDVTYGGSTKSWLWAWVVIELVSSGHQPIGLSQECRASVPTLCHQGQGLEPSLQSAGRGVLCSCVGQS